MSAVYHVEHISCGYGDRTVLKDVSFDLNRGELLGVIGPNGSGKSTLIRALTRILSLSSGRIDLFDQPLQEYSARRLAQTVAVIPQQAYIPFAFTALEVALMGRTPHLKRFQRETATDLDIAIEAMRRTDCLQFKDRTLQELSGGERQRVIIARALAQQPSALLLDEPTSYLDLNHQIDVFDLLHDLCMRDKIAMLCVSHDLNLAAEYCGRLIMIREGSVYATGAPADILTESFIREVFNADVMVAPSVYTGSPQILLKPRHVTGVPLSSVER